MAWFRVPEWCPLRTKVNREPPFSAEGEPVIDGIEFGNLEAAAGFSARIFVMVCGPRRWPL